MVTRRQFLQGATSLALLGGGPGLQAVFAATAERTVPAIKGGLQG
ncbi:twin-arginine translocation signal domain-containing protein, partial [Rhodanobacter denitrificans]|nr:twin-arginine translocation signal domain-containing protein [Rhodanobacter denitrificans]